MSAAAPVLPDVVGPGLRVIFCGTAPGLASAARGHYYAGPGNAFWALLHQAGFTNTRLSPDHDHAVGLHGIGLTDLVKTHAQSDDRGLVYDVARCEALVSQHRPGWVAFTSKEAGKAAARHLGQRPPSLGAQPWAFGGAQVFVLPSPSGRNQGRRSYDGRATRLEWWRACADAVLASPET